LIGQIDALSGIDFGLILVASERKSGILAESGTRRAYALWRAASSAF
jgi:hypothetical protein